MRIEVSRPVAAPVEVVWDVLTDIPNADRFLSGLVAVEPLSPGPYAPGYRWKETRKMFGMKATAELMATVAEPPLRTTILCEEGGVEYTTEITLVPTDSGTRIDTVWTSVMEHAPAVSRVVWTAMAPIAERSTRKGWEKDLADIAAEAERRANP